MMMMMMMSSKRSQVVVQVVFVFRSFKMQIQEPKRSRTCFGKKLANFIIADQFGAVLMPTAAAGQLTER